MQQTIQISEQAPIPDHILQLAEKHQLGQVRTCYRRRLHRFLLWFRPFWLIALAMPVFYDGCMAIWSGPDQNVALWLQICGWLAAIGPLTVSILEFKGLHLFWGIKAHLYVMDRGLLFINGGTTEIVQWNEIEKLFWSKKQIISSLVWKNGSKFRYIEDMDNAREVSMTVAGAVTERLLPEMLAHYKRIGKVKFDSLSVTQEGITNWGKHGPQAWAKVIPWNDIEDVRFERGKLGVKINDEWKDWSNGFFGMYILPNPTVCVVLIRQLLQQREQEKA